MSLFIVGKAGSGKSTNLFIVGKAGSGKSTIASALCMNEGYKPIRFAGTLYNLAYTYFSMDNKIKDRKLLQVMGTEVGRNQMSPFIWINRVLEDVTIVEKTCELMGYPKFNFVLDDCRYRNEYEALRKFGWRGVYLKVSEEIRFRRIIKRDGVANKEYFKHTSETDVDRFCDELDVIDASRPISEVYKEVLTMLEVK